MKPQPKNRNVVLVVEDEPLLRFFAVDILKEAGFNTVEASNADEALRILEGRDDIVIVFTDINMPGSMDGLLLAAAVRDRWPPIRLIITSGLVRRDTFMLPDDAVFFTKPYEPSKLSATVRRMAAQ